MKTRDKATAKTLRSLLSAIDNATAVHPTAPTQPTCGLGGDVVGKDLTEADILALLQNEMHERLEAIEIYDQHGKTEASEILRREVDTIRHYLAPRPH